MDYNASNSSNETSCQSLFTEDELEILGISQACSSIVSLLACLLVFFVIGIFKKYTFQTQKLILYMTIAIFLLSIGYIVRGFGYQYVREGAFCTGIAFYTQYNGGCILISIMCITIEMFMHSGLFQKHNLNFDKFYIPAIFLLPLLVDWIPFINKAYGPTTNWCWIRNLDPETCETFVFGLVLQYALWYVPVFVGIVIGSVLYVAAYISISRQAKNYTGIADPTHQTERRQFLLDIKQYRWYPLVFLSCNGIPFAARIITDINSKSEYTIILWVFAGMIQGLQGCILALIFTLDPITRKRLKLRYITGAIKSNILNRHSVHDYPVIACETDSKATKIEENEDKTDSLKVPLIM